MAKIIDKGWSKPGDEIPQPVGVVLARQIVVNDHSLIEPPQGGSADPPIRPMSDEAFLNLLRGSRVPAALEDKDFQPTTSPAPNTAEPQTGQRDSGKPPKDDD